MERSQQPRLLYPMDEAAALIGVKRTTLYKLVNTGKLKRIHIGGKALIPADSLAHYYASLSQPQAKHVRDEQ